MLRYCCSKYHPLEENKFLGEVEPLDNPIKTDGFCLPCYEKELEAVEEFRRIRKENKK